MKDSLLSAILFFLLALGSYQSFQSLLWIYDIAIEKIATDIDAKRNSAYWGINAR